MILPDELGSLPIELFRGLPRHELEALVASAYRQGILPSAEVQRILDLPSRFDVARFLEQAGVPLAYDEAELEADRRTWEEIRRV